ncbi:MAG: HD domain-containing protein [Desulfobacteraceae bacterium]|nr:MAG: HD domain-containing protein [Desulfobacteraceae bacterium]
MGFVRFHFHGGLPFLMGRTGVQNLSKMKKDAYSAVIPAAGFGSRMGHLKPLLPLDGRTAVERLISIFRENGIEDIYVVVGHRQSEIIRILESAGVQIVENPWFQEGMFSSIVQGVRRMASDTDAFFILPADIPLVRPVTIRLLLSENKKNPGKIVHPCFQGKRGHPPLIPGELMDPILKDRSEGGLRSFLEEHRHLAVDLEVPDRNILFDLDDPEDYREALSRLPSYDVPTPEECEVLLTRMHPASDLVVRHSRRVSKVAEVIGNALIQSGVALDPALIRAAALLHDIAKGERNHAEKGAALLRRMQFHRVADIVARHTELPQPEDGEIREAELLYLADKFVAEERVVSLEERFRQSKDRVPTNPVARENIRRRCEAAASVKRRIEKRLLLSLDELLLPQREK